MTTSMSGPYMCPSNICFAHAPQLRPAGDVVEQIAIVDPCEIKPELGTSSKNVTNETLRTQLSVIIAKIDVLEVMLKKGMLGVEKDCPSGFQKESLPPREANKSTGSLSSNKRSPWAKLKPSTIAKVRSIGRLSLMAKRMQQNKDEIMSNGSSMSNRSFPISDDSVLTPASSDSPPPENGSMRKESIVSSLASMFGKWSFSQQSSERTERVRKTIRESRNKSESRYPISRSIYFLMEKPQSSLGAFIYSRLMNTILFCSVVVSLLQTVDSEEGNVLSRPGWEIAQISLESAFAVELLMRFLAYRDKRVFFLSIFNMIDIVAVSMLAMRAVLGAVKGVDTNAYRTFRSIVPLVCSLKLLRRFEKLQLLLTAFRVALDALPVLLYTMVLIIIFFADLMYLVERDNMKDLPTALWFTTVTISTVGYGDISPETYGGRLVAAALIYVSALYMAIPIGIVGNAFSEVWADRDRLLVKQRFRSAFIQEGFTTTTMQEIFAACDADGSGEIDVEEFVMMLELMEIDMPAERMRQLFVQLDKHDEGRIRLEDVIDIFAPYQSVKNYWLKYYKAISSGSGSTDNFPL